MEEYLVNTQWLMKVGFRPSNGHPLHLWTDEFEVTGIMVDEDYRYFGIVINRNVVWSSAKRVTQSRILDLHRVMTGQSLHHHLNT